jgi:hypothetical protein
VLDEARLGERQPLAWQPLVGEVGAECKRPVVVVASVDLAGEAGDELFGVDTIGTGWVPGSFLAGDRVETLVDDGVVAVALTGDLALHDDSPSGDLDDRDPGRRIGRNGAVCRYHLHRAELRR